MLLQDLRYGLRMLRRQPLFTTTAVLTLALAIGATGAIFTLLDAVSLRPWPFPHSEQLVLLLGKDNQGNEMPLSMPDLADYGAAHSLTILAAAQGESVSLTRTGEPARLDGAFVSSRFFGLFGVRPLLGRFFDPRDDRPGAARVAVLAERIWRSRFGSDPHLIGRALILNGAPSTVIGIVPSSFEQPIAEPEIWQPIASYTAFANDRARPVAIGFGRLAPGVSLAGARTELDWISRRLAHAYPIADANKAIVLVRMHDQLTSGAAHALWLLCGAVGCILLIAAANIAGLLAARASGRRQEIAIRASLGGGVWRIVRQMLTESLLLSALGGLAGAALAWAGTRIPPAAFGDTSGPATIPAAMLALIVAAVSLATGLLFGAIPAVLARRAVDPLRAHGPATGHGRVHSVLIAAQVAFAVILLSGAGLTARSLYELMHVDPGFRTQGLLTLEYRLPMNKYPAAAQQMAFHDQVVERVSALPGVEAAGIVRALPLSGNTETLEIGLPDRPAAPTGTPYMSHYNAVTPTYFHTVGMPVLEGRGILASDGPRDRRVVVVSQSFARKYFSRRAAIGRQVLIPASDGATALIPATIVGIVGDVKQESIEEGTSPHLYVPYAQDPFLFATLVVRTTGDPLRLTRAVERAVWSIDPDQPMWKIRTLESLVDRSVRGGSRGMLAVSLAAFAGFALLLAAIGLYGVLAYTVGQRSAEFGVRMAIGASPVRIMALVLKHGLALAGAGLACGLAAALALNRFLSSVLYQVRATDPGVYAAIAALLLLVAAAALAAPARRAMRIDPARTLRHE